MGAEVPLLHPGGRCQRFAPGCQRLELQEFGAGGSGGVQQALQDHPGQES